MKGIDDNFYFIDNALKNNQATFLKAFVKSQDSENSYLFLYSNYTSEGSVWSNIDDPDNFTEQYQWKFNKSGAEVWPKNLYYVWNVYRDRCIKNTFFYNSYQDNYRIHTTGSGDETEANNGFQIYNAVSSNVINLMDLNSVPIMPKDSIFLYNSEPEPYGTITSKKYFSGQILDEKELLSNIQKCENITDEKKGYFYSKWKIGK